MISGLKLSSDFDDLVLKYYSVLLSLSLGLKFIINHLNAFSNSYDIDTILVSGGLSSNTLYLQELSNITGAKVFASSDKAMLVGSAIVAAVAGGLYSDLLVAMKSMGSSGIIYFPTTNNEVIAYYKKKYEIYLLMYEHQKV